MALLPWAGLLQVHCDDGVGVLGPHRWVQAAGVAPLHRDLAGLSSTPRLLLLHKRKTSLRGQWIVKQRRLYFLCWVFFETTRRTEIIAARRRGPKRQRIKPLHRLHLSRSGLPYPCTGWPHPFINVCTCTYIQSLPLLAGKPSFAQHSFDEIIIWTLLLLLNFAITFEHWSIWTSWFYQHNNTPYLAATPCYEKSSSSSSSAISLASSMVSSSFSLSS